MALKLLNAPLCSPTHPSTVWFWANIEHSVEVLSFESDEKRNSKVASHKTKTKSGKRLKLGRKN